MTKNPRYLLLLLCLSMTNFATGRDLQFLDGSLLETKQVYDGIPKIHGESVVLSEASWPIGEISLVFSESYDQMRNLIKDQLSNTRLGIPTVSEGITNALASRSVSVSAGSENVKRMNAANLRNSGINVTEFRELTLDFPRYNVSKEKDQFSLLRIRVADGSKMIGRPSTILTVVRIDRAKVWLRGFHSGLPLPKLDYSEVRLVTNTELNLISEFQARNNIYAIGKVFTNSSGNPFGDFDAMKKIRAVANGQPD